MICSHCVREVPDGSSHCPRCGGALSPAESAPQPVAAAEIHALLDDGGGWEPAAPTKVIRSGRGWEQTGRFTSSMVREREERALPAYSVFSARGKLNRLKYFYVQLVSSVATTIAYIALIFILVSNPPMKAIFGLAAMLIFAMILTVQVFAAVRRFHDIDEPGIHFLFLFIPFYCYYVSLKLLFRNSTEGDTDYGETVNTHYYWQTPLTLLLLPVVFFTIGMGNMGDSKLSSALGRNLFVRQYYSEQYHVGITFPNGWIRTDSEGSLASAQPLIGSEIILLDVGQSELQSFDMLTREQIEQMGKVITDERTLAESLRKTDARFEDVSDAYSNVKDINGKVFIQIGFNAKYDGSNVRGILVLGSYGDRVIIVSMAMRPNVAGGNLDAMMDAADSLVVDSPPGD